jgi:hypothetical protein
MKIPRYWASEELSARAPDGKPFWFNCWRWSETSVGEAKQLAHAKAQELLWKVQNGWVLDRYSYGDRPVREEIKQSITTDDGREVGIITRNPYGTLVLNSANAMFIDIDLEENAPPPQYQPQSPGLDLNDIASSLLSGFKSLFGGGQQQPAQPPPQPAPQPPPQPPLQQTLLSRADRCIQQIEDVARRHPDLDIRIYRTFAGFRCLITNYTFEPSNAVTTDILREIGADPLYMKLCRTQESFRARLTAKPWRCDAPRPPFRFPWANQRQEATYRNWEQQYQSIASQYATCKLVKQIGSGRVHPDVVPILGTHDQLACSPYELNLA